MNRWHALRSARARPATGFVSQPEPRTIGSFAKGRQLSAGNFLFAGTLVVEPDKSIWQLPDIDPQFEEEIQGFMWLDDLAATGDMAARERAQNWLTEWIERYGRGHGAGWTPDLTGRRLVRWINHAILLLNGQPRDMSLAYYSSLAQQTIFLSKRWQAASAGLPRFEALTGLIYAGLALTGMDAYVDPAIKALARECREQIDAEGGIPTRNPEELLEVFTLLNWAATALAEAGKLAGPDHLQAIGRIAPTLRMLRHSDGGLARFHGGGRGTEGRLDHALATSGVKSVTTDGLSMGYARLQGGRTSVILDAAKPPVGVSSYNAHASTLAFELTSGRRPLIVSCGSGTSFGSDWFRAGRATASHSTLAIDGFSSARLGRKGLIGGHERELLGEAPTNVRVQSLADEGSHGIVVGHDGYLPTHGLTHIRQIELAANGRAIAGEDTLAAIETSDERLFDKAQDRLHLQGIPFKIRFHLHPDVDADLDMGGTAISMALKSGEIWVLRHDGAAKLSLEPSVFLEKGRLKVRATKQVVLSASALEYATRIRWTLAKARETPDTVRDLVREGNV
ncbi:MAG: heparinase II/III family protein [Marinosulfonomonas sp.]|nr:heparinase II/III family protein [Marinosulfonomonas sp.]